MALVLDDTIAPGDLNAMWDSVALARAFTIQQTLDVNDITVSVRGISDANKNTIGVLPVLLPVDTHIDHIIMYVGASSAGTIAIKVEGTFAPLNQSLTVPGGSPASIDISFPHRLMALAGSTITITVTEAPETPIEIFRVHLCTRRRWTA
jgi:hypothetical protein